MLHDAESATRQINLSRKSREKLSIRLIVASCLSKKANSVCEEQRYLGFLERTKNKRQKRERPLPRFALGRFTKKGGPRAPGLFAKCQNSKLGLKDFSLMPMTRQSNLPGSSCFYFCLSLSKRCWSSSEQRIIVLRATRRCDRGRSGRGRRWTSSRGPSRSGTSGWRRP